MDKVFDACDVVLVLQGTPRPPYPGGPQIGGPIPNQMTGGRMGMVQPGTGSGLQQSMASMPPAHSYPGAYSIPV